MCIARMEVRLHHLPRSCCSRFINVLREKLKHSFAWHKVLAALASKVQMGADSDYGFEQGRTHLVARFRLDSRNIRKHSLNHCIACWRSKAS